VNSRPPSDRIATPTWQSEVVALTAVQDTRAPRAGRRFAPSHELALHGDAIAACEGLPGAHRGVFVVREMAGPVGVPDFTVLVGDLQPLHARLALDVPPVLIVPCASTDRNRRGPLNRDRNAPHDDSPKLGVNSRQMP
jgi:hypothetical protein